jgi:6-pyruvoyltetrahydropterin/6-carboxytetrahydropterin synthase
MFEIRITTHFSAAHAIKMGGVRERLHGHDWRVRVVVGAPALTAEGLVCDFHALENAVAAVIEPLKNGTLNDTPPFDVLNPTAENVAIHIGNAVKTWIATLPQPGGLQLVSASVTEAIGCEATFRP